MPRFASQENPENTVKALVSIEAELCYSLITGFDHATLRV